MWPGVVRLGAVTATIDPGDFDAFGVVADLVVAVRAAVMERGVDVVATISAPPGRHQLRLVGRPRGHVVLAVHHGFFDRRGDRSLVWTGLVDGLELLRVATGRVEAVLHGLRFGAHGLPLMGAGDWNDGMNQVGRHGLGESVWLGFFLCDVLSE